MQKLRKVVEEWNETARSAWYMSYRDRRGDTGDSAKPRVGVPSHHLDRLNEAAPIGGGVSLRAAKEST